MRKIGIGARMVMAAAGIAAMTILAVSPAAAADSRTLQPSSTGSINSPSCDYIALESTKIRSKATTNSTALGLLAKGKRIDCDSKEKAGGSYTACGGGNSWYSVNYKGGKAWVAAACVKWDPS